MGQSNPLPELNDVGHIPCGRMIDPADSSGKAICELGFSVPGDCAGCPSYTEGLTAQERTRCEVWTRVMGYHRPVAAHNAGKQQEHSDRQLFRERAG